MLAFPPMVYGLSTCNHAAPYFLFEIKIMRVSCRRVALEAPRKRKKKPADACLPGVPFEISFFFSAAHRDPICRVKEGGCKCSHVQCAIYEPTWSHLTPAFIYFFGPKIPLSNVFPDELEKNRT